jgi:hypothetical protein
VTLELGRLLVASGAVSSTAVQAALFASVRRGVHLLQALLEMGALDEGSLERELASSDAPAVRSVAPVPDLVARLPRGLCRRLLACPVRSDPFTGTIDVATASPFDPHVQSELGYHLGAPVRVVRAPLSAVLDALGALEGPAGAADDAEGRATMPHASADPDPFLTRRTPAFGVPAIPLSARLRSDAPIPLVRRSHAPRRDDTLDEEDIVQVTPSAPPAAPDPPDATGTGLDRVPRPPLRDPLASTSELTLIDPQAPRHATPSDARSSVSGRDPGERNGDEPQRLPAPPRTPRLTTEARARVDSEARLAQVLEAIGAATSRDEVVEHLVAGLRTVAGRVGILAVRRGHFVGWACSPTIASPALFRALSVPCDAPTVLASAAERGWFLGPVEADAHHDELLGALGSVPDELSVVSVRVSARPALLLVAADLGDAMNATHAADTLAYAASEALGRILRSDKPPSSR